MTNVYFHPEVARDIRESVVWYESQAKGLGGDFINELESALQPLPSFLAYGFNSEKDSGVISLPVFPCCDLQIKRKNLCGCRDALMQKTRLLVQSNCRINHASKAGLPKKA